MMMFARRCFRSRPSAHHRIGCDLVARRRRCRSKRRRRDGGTQDVVWRLAMQTRQQHTTTTKWTGGESSVIVTGWQKLPTGTHGHTMQTNSQAPDLLHKVDGSSGSNDNNINFEH
jgi:hypothetical protein